MSLKSTQGFAFYKDETKNRQSFMLKPLKETLKFVKAWNRPHLTRILSTIKIV